MAHKTNHCGIHRDLRSPKYRKRIIPKKNKRGIRDIKHKLKNYGDY